MQRKSVYRFLEFFIVGFLMGITEDIIAIYFATDASITPYVILVAAVVALPFAVFSEIIVDRTHIKFLKKAWEKNFSTPKKKG